MRSRDAICAKHGVTHRVWVPILLLGLVVGACGDDDDPQSGISGSSAAVDGGGDDTRGMGSGASEPVASVPVGSTGAAQSSVTPSSGAGPDPAPLPAYAAGPCPAIAAGDVSFQSGELARRVVVELPPEPAGAPVLFVYHGAGSNPAQFQAFFRTAQLAADHGYIVVVPAASGVFMIEWPLLPGERTELEVGLFTDVLYCLDEAFGIDRRRVYTTGFSAGGLWSTYLALYESNYLAAAAIFSGGVSDVTHSYRTPDWRIPILATHGGPTDEVALRFDLTTEALVDGLLEDGNLVVLCPHDEGHVIPWPLLDILVPFLGSFAFGDVDPDWSEADMPASWPAACTRQ